MGAIRNAVERIVTTLQQIRRRYHYTPLWTGGAWLSPLAGLSLVILPAYDEYGMAGQQFTKKQTYWLYNKLTSIVNALENEYTEIDLRNESIVCGKIVCSDGLMNVDMVDVLYTDPKGRQYYFDNFHVCARNILQVHIPNHLDPLELIRAQHSCMDRSKGQNEPKVRTFKQVRSLRYNEEIKQQAFGQPGPSKS